MGCERLNHGMKSASRWHRLRCAECSKARRTDAEIAMGIARMRVEAVPATGLSRALGAFGQADLRPARRPSLWRGIRRVSLPAGAVTAVLALSAYGWVHYLDIDPKVTAPGYTLPTPNAYSIYELAGQDIVRIKEIDAALSCPLTPPVKMQEQLQHSTKPGPVYYSNSFGVAAGANRPYYSLTDQELLLKDNSGVLNEVRRGLRLAYYQAPTQHLDETPPHYWENVRKLGSLFALEVKVHSGRHDWQAAMTSGLDGLRFGNQLPKGGTIIARLVGTAVQAQCRKLLWKVVANLTASQARMDAQRLEWIMSDDVPFEESVIQEKWATLDSLQRELKRPGWRIGFSGLDQAGHDSGNVGLNLTRQNLEKLWSLYRFSKRQIVNTFIERMDEEYRRSLRPYRRNLPEQPEPVDAVNQMMSPYSLNGARFQSMARHVVQDRFLLVALALQVYRQEHGDVPAKLGALVPGYLSRIPEDPFLPGHELGYRRRTEKFRIPEIAPNDLSGYVLYSVGPDGVDNGGTPMERPRGQLDGSDRRYLMDPTLNGDIVANVNL